MSVTVSILLAVRPSGTKTRYRVAFQFDYSDLPFYPNFKPADAVFAHFNHGDSNLSDTYFRSNRSLSIDDVVLFHDNSGAIARVDGYRFTPFQTVALSERDVDNLAYVHPDCHRTEVYAPLAPLAPWEQELLNACGENFGRTWAESNHVEQFCNYADGHAGNCSPLDHKERLDQAEQDQANANEYW